MVLYIFAIVNNTDKKGGKMRIDKMFLKGMKLLCLLVLLIIMASCGRTSFTDVLCGDDVRYWEYEDNDYSLFPLYFLFDKNGRWLPLEQDEEGNIKEHVLSNCVKWNKGWSSPNNSILYLGWDNIGYNIQSYCDSCIILKQNDKVLKLRAVNNIQATTSKYATQYKERMDSIKNVNYEIIVDSVHEHNGIFLVYGTTHRGNKTVITYTDAEGRLMNIRKGDDLIKKKDWVLLSKMTNDTIYLYRYFVTSRNCSLIETPLDSALRLSTK